MEPSPVLLGIVMGFLLSAVNVAAGLAVARRAQRLPVNQATTLVLTAMALRLFAMVVLIVVVLTTFEVNRLAFALTLMVSFFVMVLMEAFFLHARHEKSKTPLLRRRRYRRARVPFTVW
ncbi:MAG: hypothetical protein KatS3mg040_1336 [Candidatus Kapaibacterium sp.]|nr:MAG: hypothetical protein KatS3mg040_1336 [Candidatus Kapabacteria bacterium]